MRRQRRSGLFALIRVFLWIACLGLGSLPAVSGPIVSFAPVPLCGGFPDTVVTLTASVWVDASGDSLGCFHILMAYDRTHLQLERATEGSLFRNAGPPYIFIHEYPQLDTTAFTCCLLGNRTYVMGPGELVKLRFRVLQCPPGNRTGLDLVTRRVSPPPEDLAFFADIDRQPVPGVDYREGIALVCNECTSSEEEEEEEEEDGGEADARLVARPNPAAERLSLGWDLPSGSEAAQIEIFASDGRLVMRRMLGQRSGSFDWDMRDPRGESIVSGAYFVRLQVGDRTILRKIVHVQ